jgi:iron(II)-dependent oxidoreductase
MMARKFDAHAIALLMESSREDTRELLRLVKSESDLRREPSAGFRPILWHLGHVAAFEGYWLLQRVKGSPPISKEYDRIFDPIKTPREDLSRLPSMPDIEEYLMLTRREVLKQLASCIPDDSNPLLKDGYIFNMVLEHEYQHQETVAYLLQMLGPAAKRAHADSLGVDHGPVELPQDAGSMVRIAGGPFELGSAGHPFAYDNEQPPQEVTLQDFEIDKYPVTNREFEEFIRAGGYRTRDLWGNEGWHWKESSSVEHPLYWRPARSGAEDWSWEIREMFGEAPARPGYPVTGVSHFEAEAYARWAGKRLPTEAEWEKAASWDANADRKTGQKRQYSWGDEPPTSKTANFSNQNWGPTPVGAFQAGQSAYGCFDMTGNVWEWTATTFEGYPGFEPFPYPEYSELWFDGDHRVLKGGSWTTRAPLLRCSFRNFFRPQFRAAFAGFRCASDY